MKEVIVLQGIPGSGKSTLAAKLVEEAQRAGHSTAVVSADHYFVKLGNGTFRFMPERLGEAHGECFRNFLGAVVEDTNLIIVDNCNVRAVDCAAYVAAANAFGYKAQILRVLCDPDIAAARNIHGVTAEYVSKMASRLTNEAVQGRFPSEWCIQVAR